MGLDDATAAERIGAPLDGLNHALARTAISVLRKEMEESGTWQPRVGEGPDQEGEYLAKLRDRQAVLDVRLINGEQLSGTVVDFTPYVIQLRDPESGAHVSVRKLAVAFYQTRGPVDDAE
jgi:sRNA-binding regulator protein Hfq